MNGTTTNEFSNGHERLVEVERKPQAFERRVAETTARSYNLMDQFHAMHQRNGLASTDCASGCLSPENARHGVVSVEDYLSALLPRSSGEAMETDLQQFERENISPVTGRGGVTIEGHPWPPVEWARLDWPNVDLPDFASDRRGTCYHEAAHAVLGVLFKLPVGNTHVFEAGRGRVELLRASPDHAGEPIPSRSAVFEMSGALIAAAYLGGVMAELLLLGIKVGGCLQLDTPDWRNARTVLMGAFTDDFPLFYCQCLASAVLMDHWDWVEAVAGAVSDEGTLSIEMVRFLCPERA